jgi:hypothetical protein
VEVFVSFKSRCSAAFLLLVLEFGALTGVPMTPEKIRAVMESINRLKQAHTRPVAQDDGPEL